MSKHEINCREAQDGDGYLSENGQQTERDCHEANR